MTWLQNSWMDNPTFLAEMAHFAWAYGVLLTAALFSASRRQMFGIFFAFACFALGKEFWYDLVYELPNDTVYGSALDFAMYMLGLCAALAVIWLQRQVAARRARLAEMRYYKAMSLLPRERTPLRLYDPD